MCTGGPGQAPLEPCTGPRVQFWDSAASCALTAALETPSPSSGRGGEGLGVLGSPSAAPCTGWSWAELTLWLKAETPQRGGPGLSLRNLPRAQTGSPQRTALGIQTGLGRRAPSQLGFSLARNKRLFPETPARAQKPDKTQIRCTRRPDPPPASPSALQLWARAAKGRRSEHWVSVSRPPGEEPARLPARVGVRWATPVRRRPVSGGKIVRLQLI